VDIGHATTKAWYFYKVCDHRGMAFALRLVAAIYLCLCSEDAHEGSDIAVDGMLLWLMDDRPISRVANTC
jgi:hypothetical protein